MITRLLMLARLVAAFAMLTQAFAPTAMAVANPRIDPAQLICITPGNPATDVSLRMAQRLADVLNDTSDVPPVQQDHCPLCLIATAAPLPETPVVKQPRFFCCAHGFCYFRTGFCANAAWATGWSNWPSDFLLRLSATAFFDAFRGLSSHLPVRRFSDASVP